VPPCLFIAERDRPIKWPRSARASIGLSIGAPPASFEKICWPGYTLGMRDSKLVAQVPSATGKVQLDFAFEVLS
jgi:hypothetical protein